MHVDQKAPRRVHSAARALADCYNLRFGPGRVDVVRNPIPVYWGHISVLDADLVRTFLFFSSLFLFFFFLPSSLRPRIFVASPKICLHELLARDADWTHFVNTAGTELPLAPYSVKQVLPNQCRYH